MDKRIATIDNTPSDKLWCTDCLEHLTSNEIWLSDDMRDGKIYCFDCAPDDAIRLKDTI